jgi:RecB family exonuclease
MVILSTSRLTAARRCKRLHHLRYDLGYRPLEDAEALRFGSLVHAGLEGWWRARKNVPDKPAVWLQDALNELSAADANEFDFAKAEAIVNAYHARWADTPARVLAVEQRFEAPLVNPETGRPSRTWSLGGKIDAVVELPDGRIVIVEHKTSGVDISPGSDYWKLLRIDGQVTMYYLGARALGYDVEGCLYDVIKKPGQRPLQANKQRAVPETAAEYGKRVLAAMAEDLGGYFIREMIVRLAAEEAEGLYDIWQTAQEIHEGKRAGRAPRNPNACLLPGRPCEFFAACCGEASLDDETKYRRSSNVHPELTETARKGSQEVF